MTSGTADVVATRRGVRRREWIGWFVALGVVTAAMVSIRSHLNEAHVTLAYLLVVQGASARGGRPLGFALAAAAFLCFDLFFLPPFGALTIQDPLNWFVLVGFLGTSILSAQLLYRAQAEADVARRRAAEIDQLAATRRAKDAVLASVSHDLRTPLTTIKALAAEITAGGDDRAAIIEEEADRLTTFVAQLLDLSRISSGAAMYDMQPNEAEDLLGAAAQQVAGHLKGRELRIDVASDDALLFGRFDFAQTLRALVNLIENAAKYSPNGAPIDLSAEREGSFLVFAVADRGPGVPPAERERIFEAFYRRADQAPDVGGAGLGLSIARAIADAQGGDVTVAGRDGGGSVFRLRVPAITVAEPT